MFTSAHGTYAPKKFRGKPHYLFFVKIFTCALVKILKKKKLNGTWEFP